MTSLRNAGIHLVARELATLTGFGTLGHLDLDVRRIDQVVAGDAEASRRHLLDSAASTRVVEPVGIFAALAGVRPAAEGVHGDGHRLVGLGGDGAVAHRTRVEARDDRLDRLDLLQRHRWAQPRLQFEQSAQRAAVASEPIHLVGVLLEDLAPAGTGRMLQEEDYFRREQVQLTLPPERILATHVEATVDAFGRIVGVRASVAKSYLLGEDVQTDTAELGRCPGEIL